MGNEGLEQNEGMAVLYSGLGSVYFTRGELDKAERFYIRALKVNESLEQKRAMAAPFSQLGMIYSVRGDFKTACQYWNHSLEILNKTGDSAMAKGFKKAIDNQCGSKEKK